MKKILLSSIIMLGVCGAVNAQTGSKFKKNEASTSTSSAAAPTPQKAAVVAESDLAPATPATAATTTAADKQAVQTAPVSRGKAKEQAKQQQAQQAQTSVNAAGVVLSDEEKVKADKAEKAKAAGENDKRAN